MNQYLSEQETFLDIVHEAREEWMQAQNYFDNVSDPDLVDYAIYKVEAARRKYMYLMKQARIMGIEERRLLQPMHANEG